MPVQVAHKPVLPARRPAQPSSVGVVPVPVSKRIRFVLTVAALACVAGPGSALAVTITHTIVLDRSIAGVRLGETRASIERRIGAGFVLGEARTDTSTTRPRQVERIEYDAAGLYVTYVSPGGSARQLAAGRAVVLETTWTSFRTPQGVHVGSPQSALTSIPGVRCFAGVCQHGYAGRRGGTSFLVDPVRKRVVRIVVSFAH
jgi:hypothetical protein